MDELDGANDASRRPGLDSIESSVGRKRKRFAGSNIELGRNDIWCIKFRKARLRAGLTQRELSGLLNVSHAAVCLWENGMNFPNRKKFDTIETILGVTLFDRVGRAYQPSRAADYITLIKIFQKLSKAHQDKVLGLALELSDQTGDINFR